METQQTKKRFNFQKLAIVLSIIVVLNLFFNYGVSTFYDAPEYDNFCTEEFLAKKYDTQEACESEDVGGLWIESDVYYGGRAMPKPVMMEEPIIGTVDGYCDASKSCRDIYQTAIDLYNRNVFIILLVTGLASLTASFFILAEAVSIGLSYGGILSVVIGAMRYWSAMDDYLRFAILGIALTVLIWVGVKKVREE